MEAHFHEKTAKRRKEDNWVKDKEKMHKSTATKEIFQAVFSSKVIPIDQEDRDKKAGDLAKDRERIGRE